MKVGMLGLLLTTAVTAGTWRVWGDSALLPAATFGLLATVIQLVAVRALARRYHGTLTEFYSGFGTGLMLRMGGVLLLVIAILIDREHFAPLPTAFGYLGVVIPLLFLEARFVR